MPLLGREGAAAHRAGLRGRAFACTAVRVPAAVPGRVTPCLPLPPSGPHRPAQALYRLSEASRAHLRGCTDAMCSTTWYPQGMRGPHWQPPQPPPRIITDSDTEHDDIPWSGYVPA